MRKTMRTTTVLVLLLVLAGVCRALTLPGEIAHYPLHDGIGTEAKEAQGRFSAATIHNTFWLTRDGLSLIDFSGMKGSREARVVFPPIEMEGEFTIALWLSAYWWRDNWSPIFYRSDASCGIRNNIGHPGQLHFRVKDPKMKRGANLFSNIVLDTNRWYHVVAVFKPGQFMRLYIDGKLDSERTMNVPAQVGKDEHTFTVCWRSLKSRHSGRARTASHRRWERRVSFLRKAESSPPFRGRRCMKMVRFA